MIVFSRWWRRRRLRQPGDASKPAYNAQMMDTIVRWMKRRGL